MEQGRIERLAFAQALYDAIGAIVSTKDPDSLRHEADEHYRELYEQTGGKSFEVRFGDEKVGTYSVRISNGKPKQIHHYLRVVDFEALAQWFDDNVSDEECRHIVALDLPKLAENHFHDDGEIPDGCELDEIVTIDNGGEYQGGTLKISSDFKAAVLEFTQGQQTRLLEAMTAEQDEEPIYEIGGEDGYPVGD